MFLVAGYAIIFVAAYAYKKNALADLEDSGVPQWSLVGLIVVGYSLPLSLPHVQCLELCSDSIAVLRCAEQSWRSSRSLALRPPSAGTPRL